MRKISSTFKNKFFPSFLFLLILSLPLPILAEAETEIIKTEGKEGAYQLITKLNRQTNEYSWYLSNLSYDDMDITFLLETTGMISDRISPVREIIPPLTNDRLIIKTAYDGVSARFRYSAKFNYYTGNPDAKHDAVYNLPFCNSEQYRIDNGFNGYHAHKGKYAVDISMPSGSKVCAAREGVVVDLKSDSDRGGPSMDYAKDGNMIRIRHEDGTYSVYAHFQKDGVLVQIGEKVQRGQVIGLSGNTGYSFGPHLHFEVSMANGEGGLKTLPFLFKDSAGAIFEPKIGQTVK